MVLTTSTTTRTSSASSPRPDTGVHVVCTRTYVRMAYDDAPCTLACIMLLYLLPLGPSTSSRPVPPPPSRPAATDGAATFCWAVATGSERRNPGPAPRRDKRSRVARSIACVAPIDDSSESSRIRRRRQQCRSGTVFYCWLLCPGKQALCRLRSCMRLRVCVPGPARKGRRRDAAMRNRRQAAS